MSKNKIKEIPVETFQEQYYRKKIEAKQKRKEFFKDFSNFIKTMPLALGIIGLSLLLMYSILGGIMYCVDKTKIENKLSDLEYKQGDHSDDIAILTMKLEDIESRLNTNVSKETDYNSTNYIDCYNNYLRCFTNKVYFRMEHSAYDE